MTSDNSSQIFEFLRNKINSSELNAEVYDYGTVVSCSDDIVHIKGLSGSLYSELLMFEDGAYGLALDLDLDGVGAVLLGDSDKVTTGSVVRGTGRVADICVGEKLLGRVIDPIGRPLDGRELVCDEFRRIEQPAPTIMQRSAVDTPLQTGILSVDSMIPIGRGQRELIIGDRQTGKTSIALSAIMNQKDNGVICVYCAIGQKAAGVASLVHTLSENGCLEHTVVLAAFADECAAMQYLAPYAACSVAEYFMNTGRDVLIVYDDLSKHAAAYRAMSLLLRRPSGREAYPGDIFYLHSRLLERAAKLSPERGGGSMTALPIVETQAGDISAYIPTNVISITDGQIYLETELFSSGVRPAINVGLSVSRVGRKAQCKAMKSVSGSLRIDVARYRDMAVFAQFGADLDPATADALHRGERLTELLKQGANERLSVSEEVVLLLTSSNNILENIPGALISEIKKELLAYVRKSAASAMIAIDNTGEMKDDDREMILSSLSEFAERKAEELAKHK